MSLVIHVNRPISNVSVQDNILNFLYDEDDEPRYPGDYGWLNMLFHNEMLFVDDIKLNMR